MSQALARALALFDDCVAMAPAERAAMLAGLAREEPDTHRALQILLAADDALQDAGEHDLLPKASIDVLPARPGMRAAPDVDADQRIGSRLGPWRIDRLLDSGGMGTVYEAWRDDGQYDQRVALKCIRSELTSPRLIDSFRRERDALAALEHPGIATLFDGGVEPDGHPWFAMRYVQGAQIDAWCDARGAGLQQRVDLLMQVCDALAYAHQRRVLHQDIKPSNLMVTDAGQVQVLDFGLAASLAATDVLPRIAASDSYTAPEAMAGAMPAMTMDIWSLGMLMYRLLCGALPHASQPLLSTVLEREKHGRPPPMSRLAARSPASDARVRGFGDAGALARALAGDLDAIAARCVAPDPAARYATVAALRDDLQAWRQKRPVQARGAGALYRAGRFLQRHRLAAGLAGVILMVLMAGTGLVAWQRDRAAREATAALALSQVFEQMLGNATLSGLGDTPMSSGALLADTERQVRALPLQEHPVVLARGLSLLARNYSVVGDYDRATRLAAEAAGLQGDDPPGLAAAQATLAALLNLQGRPREAQVAAREGLKDIANAGALPTRLQLLTELARSQWDLGEQDLARHTLDKALALAGDHRLASEQAELLTLRGYWNTRLTRFAQADADLRHAIALATPSYPLVANEARRVLAQNLLVQDRVDDGLRIAEELLADYRRRLGDSHPLVGRAWRVLANLQCTGGQLEACAASIDHAERIVRLHFGDQHPEFADVLRVRSVLGMFGRSSTDDAITSLRRAETLLLAAYPPQHETVLRVRQMLARRLLSSDPKGRDESITLMETVMADHAKGRISPPPILRITLAEGLLKRAGAGDLQRARELVEQNEAALRAYPPTYSMVFYNRYLLAYVTYLEGDAVRADALLERLAIDIQEHVATTNNRFTLRDALMLRAMIVLRRGDLPAARTRLAEAVARTEAMFGPEHPAARRTRAQLDALDRTGTFQLLR